MCCLYLWREKRKRNLTIIFVHVTTCDWVFNIIMFRNSRFRKNATTLSSYDNLSNIYFTSRMLYDLMIYNKSHVVERKDASHAECWRIIIYNVPKLISNKIFNILSRDLLIIYYSFIIVNALSLIFAITGSFKENTHIQNCLLCCLQNGRKEQRTLCVFM